MQSPENYFETTLIYSLNNLLCSRWEKIARRSGLASNEIARMKAHPREEMANVLLLLRDKHDGGLAVFRKVLEEDRRRTINEACN